MTIEAQQLVLLAIVAIATLTLVHFAQTISQVLRELFRGGPRPPSHPLPGDDSVILNRRRSKSAA